jgi:hypothetical protein
MPIEVILTQLALGILLFFIINWIGKQSYSIGYMEISMFVKVEEAPALNFLMRVLSPIVYIIIISAILYYFKLDKFVTNIYYINIYYIIIRLLFNLVSNRWVLLNWYQQSLYWITIITISYFAYEKIIKVKTNVLPDFTTIANELWIIIIIFLYQVTNNIKVSEDSGNKRKSQYLISRYKHFNRKYGNIINNKCKNNILEAIVYSVLIYEDFNRPKVIRYIENIKQRVSGKSHTLGVMQVLSQKVISDEESVIKGTDKIINAYHKYVQHIKQCNEDFSDYSAYATILNDYNRGVNYRTEVPTLINEILEIFYPDTKDTLDPSTK